ncbi:MAG: hypothetical protein LBU32_19920 [Clostridiales bacterium]|jgi:hypothetical protein|nr:hypothetical protein [Clostridiales bacterium]
MAQTAGQDAGTLTEKDLIVLEAASKWYARGKGGGRRITNLLPPPLLCAYRQNGTPQPITLTLYSWYVCLTQTISGISLDCADVPASIVKYYISGRGDIVRVLPQAALRKARDILTLTGGEFRDNARVDIICLTIANEYIK